MLWWVRNTPVSRREEWLCNTCLSIALCCFSEEFHGFFFLTSSLLLLWIWCWAVHSKQMHVLEVTSRSLLAHKECQWIDACQTSEVNEMMCSQREKKKSVIVAQKINCFCKQKCTKYKMAESLTKQFLIFNKGERTKEHLTAQQLIS